MNFKIAFEISEALNYEASMILYVTISILFKNSLLLHWSYMVSWYSFETSVILNAIFKFIRTSLILNAISKFIGSFTYLNERFNEIQGKWSCQLILK